MILLVLGLSYSSFKLESTLYSTFIQINKFLAGKLNLSFALCIGFKVKVTADIYHRNESRKKHCAVSVFTCCPQQKPVTHHHSPVVKRKLTACSA